MFAALRPMRCRRIRLWPMRFVLDASESARDNRTGVLRKLSVIFGRGAVEVVRKENRLEQRREFVIAFTQHGPRRRSVCGEISSHTKKRWMRPAMFPAVAGCSRSRSISRTPSNRPSRPKTVFTPPSCWSASTAKRVPRAFQPVNARADSQMSRKPRHWNSLICQSILR